MKKKKSILYVSNYMKYLSLDLIMVVNEISNEVGHNYMNGTLKMSAQIGIHFSWSPPIHIIISLFLFHLSFY